MIWIKSIDTWKVGILLLCIPAAIIISAVSGGANFLNGMSYGHTSLQQYLFGGASFGADLFKIAFGMGAIAALLARQYVLALVVCVLFLLCTAYSVRSAIGFAALSRTDAVAQRNVSKSLSYGAQNLLEAKQKQLSGISGQLKTMRHNDRWITTTQCTNPTVRRSISYCQKYNSLLAAHEKADRDIWKLRTDLKKTPPVTHADPQVWLINKLVEWGITGAPANKAEALKHHEATQIGDMLFFGLFIELLSAVAWPVLWRLSVLRESKARPEESRKDSSHESPKKNSRKSVELSVVPDQAVEKLTAEKAHAQVERYFADRIELSAGASIQAQDLYDNFVVWHESQKESPEESPITQTLMGTLFTDLVKPLGVTKGRDNNRVHYFGISLKGAEHPALADAA